MTFQKLKFWVPTRAFLGSGREQKSPSTLLCPHLSLLACSALDLDQSCRVIRTARDPRRTVAARQGGTWLTTKASVQRSAANLPRTSAVLPEAPGARPAPLDAKLRISSPNQSQVRNIGSLVYSSLPK